MSFNIAIVVLNWNQAKLTTDTLNSLLKIKPNSSFKWHIFVVDNASTDSSLSILKKTFSKSKKITFLKSSKNLGYTGGNNLGIKAALKNNFSHILIANNDILVKDDFLAQLVSVAKLQPQSVLAPKIYFAPGFEYHYHYQKKDLGKVIWAMGGKFDWQNIYGSNIGIDEVDRGQYDQADFDIDFISGCCFLAPTTLFKKIGLLDDRFYLYLEDVDFTHRAKSAGYQLLVVPKSVIWHLNSGSSKPGSDIQEYFITRNRLLFAKKFASTRTKLALFRESLKFLFSPSYWRRQGVIDFYVQRFGRGSWQ